MASLCLFSELVSSQLGFGRFLVSSLIRWAEWMTFHVSLTEDRLYWLDAPILIENKLNWSVHYPPCPGKLWSCNRIPLVWSNSILPISCCIVAWSDLTYAEWKIMICYDSQLGSNVQTISNATEGDRDQVNVTLSILDILSPPACSSQFNRYDRLTVMPYNLRPHCLVDPAYWLSHNWRPTRLILSPMVHTSAIEKGKHVFLKTRQLGKPRLIWLNQFVSVCILVAEPFVMNRAGWQSRMTTVDVSRMPQSFGVCLFQLEGASTQWISIHNHFDKTKSTMLRIEWILVDHSK